jgi:glyoxylase-like metal-dependent hydrolase (beta-lactamase superfamily II)
MTHATNDGTIDFTTAAPVAGSLDVAWVHGARNEPAIQVHAYDEHTVILRQSKRLHYEGPFLYLLFGNDRALLLDTGATADPALFPLREMVDGLIAAWLERYPRECYELVVAHTHGHGDHVAADAQFAGRPDTTVVGREPEAVQAYFGFGEKWPDETVRFDLGDRVLELLGSPGHHKAAVTVYDPWTGFLLTGDTILPGRLYVFDFPAFQATLDRLVDFAATRPVTYLLGCHVEMGGRPRQEYPLGATYQPEERAPQIAPEQLAEIRDVAAAVAGRRGVHRFDDFTIYNEPRQRDMLKLLAGGLVHKLRSRLTRRA